MLQPRRCEDVVRDRDDSTRPGKLSPSKERVLPFENGWVNNDGVMTDSVGEAAW